MTNAFDELINFLTTENVRCSISEENEDTLRFRSYGNTYTVRYDESKKSIFLFAKVMEVWTL